MWAPNLSGASLRSARPLKVFCSPRWGRSVERDSEHAGGIQDAMTPAPWPSALALSPQLSRPEGHSSRASTRRQATAQQCGECRRWPMPPRPEASASPQGLLQRSASPGSGRAGLVSFPILLVFGEHAGRSASWPWWGSPVAPALQEAEQKEHLCPGIGGYSVPPQLGVHTEHQSGMKPVKNHCAQLAVSRISS